MNTQATQKTTSENDFDQLTDVECLTIWRFATGQVGASKEICDSCRQMMREVERETGYSYQPVMLVEVYRDLNGVSFDDAIGAVGRATRTVCGEGGLSSIPDSDYVTTRDKVVKSLFGDNPDITDFNELGYEWLRVRFQQEHPERKTRRTRNSFCSVSGWNNAKRTSPPQPPTA